MTHVTYRLTAKNWDQLCNSTLGSRVWGYLYLFVWSSVSETVGHMSICLTVGPAAACRCSGFAAVGPAAGRAIESCTAGAQHVLCRSSL